MHGRVALVAGLALILLPACGSRSQLEVATAELADASPAPAVPLGISCPQTSVQRDAPWPMPYRCPDNSNFVPVPALVAPHVAWTTTSLGRIPTPPSIFTRPGIVSADGVIHLQGISDLFAINPEGSIRKRTPGGGMPVAVGADGTVYVYGAFDASPMNAVFTLRALNPDGSIRWTTQAGPPTSALGITMGNDGTAYVLGTNRDPYCPTGSVIAVRADGSALWTVPASCSDGNPASIGFPGVGADGTIYFGSDTGDLVLPSSHIEAVASDGTVRWRNDDLPAGQPIVGFEGTIYYSVVPNAPLNASGPVITRAYARDGAPRWDTSHAGTMAAKPDGDVLLLENPPFPKKGSTLYDFHPDGSIAWSLDLLTLNADGFGGTPIVVNDAIYLVKACIVADCTPGITALSWQGDLLWTVGEFDPLWVIAGKNALYALSVDLDSWEISLVAISD